MNLDFGGSAADRTDHFLIQSTEIAGTEVVMDGAIRI